jgi:acetylornithine/N-succinyldiaminopimelate aminotransferase
VTASSSALVPTYARANIAFVRGEGVWLTSTDGMRYLDFGSGVAVNALGHCHPHLVAALQKQAQTLWHTSNLYRIEDGERLAERLCAESFAERVFFCNSGAEAMEAAIKMARKYWAHRGLPEKYRLITFEGAFHGRTLATIAAGGQAKYLEGFGPKVDGFDSVPFGDHDALKRAVTKQTAGIIIEPIQGEGGIRSVPNVCLKGLRAFCDEKDLLLILDEVQTGMGRTGRLFAFEESGITPDILATAKGIGSGFPLGACLATEKASAGLTAGTHGTTFGGNPLAMAVGNAVLDVLLSDGFLAGVRARAERLKSELYRVAKAYPSVILDVRGKGFLLGLKVAPLNTDFVAAAREEKLLLVGAGDNVVRLLPPLIVTEEEIAVALEALERVAKFFTKPL